MRRVIFVMLSALCILRCEVSHASSGTEGASFLDIPVGAGPASLGSAYSALAHDAYAPVYNPAGLGFVRGPEVAAQHLSYLDSMDYEFGSFVMPLNRTQNDSPYGPQPTDYGSLGLSVQYLGSGNISGTDPSGAPIGDFSAHYAAYSLAYGRKVLDNLSFGLTGKAIQAALADVSASAYAADLGALYEANDKLALSATLNNLGTQLTFDSQGDSLPMAFHLGAAYQIESSLKSTVEAVYSKTGLVSGRFGTEWSPLEAISLRAGYKTDTLQGLSPLAGLTVGMGVHVFGQEFAYAWLPYGDLGDTQYFSLLLKFGAEREERENLIENETIKRHRTVRTGNDHAGQDTSYGYDQDQKSDPDYQQLMELLKENDAHVAQHGNEPTPQ